MTLDAWLNSIDHLRKRYLIAAIVFTLAMLLVQICLQPAPARGGPCGHLLCVASFQLSATPEEKCEVLRYWGEPDSQKMVEPCQATPQVISAVRLGLWWDFGFALGYGVLGMLALSVLLACAQVQSARRRSVALALFPLAALADWGENVVTLAWLSQLDSAPLAQAMQWWALAKWVLLGVGFAVGIGLAVYRRSLGPDLGRTL